MHDARKQTLQLFQEIAFGGNASFIKPEGAVVSGIHAVNAYGGCSPSTLRATTSVSGSGAMSPNTMSYRSNGPSFDDIKDMAITSRKRILDMVATDAFGIGRCVAVRYVGDSSQRGNRYRLIASCYSAVPDRWQPLTVPTAICLLEPMSG